MSDINFQDDAVICANCQFYVETNGKVHSGYCHRYPPVLVSKTIRDNLDDLPLDWSQPAVFDYASCGEFERPKNE